MAVTVMLELRAKPGTGGALVESFRPVLPETRAYEGCRGVVVHQNADDPDVVVLVEDWDSREHYEKYLQWRTETGLIEKLGQALAEPPSIRYFNRTDV